MLGFPAALRLLDRTHSSKAGVGRYGSGSALQESTLTKAWLFLFQEARSASPEILEGERRGYIFR